MTGPEHYREAERLLKVAENETERGSKNDMSLIAEAQVHAALALAAATALSAVSHLPMSSKPAAEWNDAAGIEWEANQL